MDLRNHKLVVERLDHEAEKRNLTEVELEQRRDNFKKVVEIEKFKALDIKQKSRIKWAVDVDENTIFFHGYVNSNNRKNGIDGIMINGNWCTDLSLIKMEAFNFFAEKFKERWPSRPKLVSRHFKQILPTDNELLETPFTLQEIKDAVWACGNEKAPGPDGFSFKFYKKYWDVLLGDIAAVVKHFERHGRIDQSCNSSFISLVPKIKDPSFFSDYRPISLIGSIYKIISKLLASRLQMVLGNCIDEVQSAYVEGRNILDGPLVVNEVCSWAKASKKKVLLFKADFNKAFDSINWGFLDANMKSMGFGDIWRGWIKGCLESAKSSILINGCPTDEFPITKGVRQGDPLSPFLFIIAMEGLSVSMRAACERGVFNGIKIPNGGPVISHLLYADDALFLGEWSEDNIKNLSRILHCFHVASGLKVNFNKSRVFGVGVSTHEVTRRARPLGCEPAKLPFNYLGVPVGANMNLIKHWSPVIDKFHAKLSKWKSKTLSFGVG